MRFLNSSQAFGSSFYPERVENTSTESIIFRCASVVAPQSRDRSAETKVYPVALYIRHRFEVLTEVLAAVDTHCDDYVYPVAPWSLDVEHASSILDVLNHVSALSEARFQGKVCTSTVPRGAFDKAVKRNPPAIGNLHWTF